MDRRAVPGRLAGLGGIRRSGFVLEMEPAARDIDRPDWLLDGSSYRAGIFRSDRDDELVLCNGLIRRVFRLGPNAATIGFDNLITGESVIRGVKPEARVEIDGVSYDIGGLLGQPNYAFLRPEWIDSLRCVCHPFKYHSYCYMVLEQLGIILSF